MKKGIGKRKAVRKVTAFVVLFLGGRKGRDFLAESLCEFRDNRHRFCELFSKMSFVMLMDFCKFTEVSI